ncbi:type IV secretory pathway VirB10-like protein [Skermanella aerolata]|uniref:TrbI/VirB10 family protein n=1 Tax=Skermanella aerolata TaxID=393310 RepID=UPI003D1D0AE1
MTFDPETLYAKPKPGRRINPLVWPVAGVAAVAIIGGLATMDKWLPGNDDVASGPPPIRSQSTGTTKGPLAFPDRYAPVVYNPPAEPPAVPKPEAAAVPPPVPTPAPQTAPRAAPSQKRERSSMLALDGGGTNRSSGSGTVPAGAASPGGGGVQPVAGSGRESFYGGAGRGSEAFQPTGIMGQIGPCTVAPGYYLFADAIGVISTDTPGQVTAKTSRPIYAGPKGQCYASPPGATLVGAFNSNTSYGEERIQLAWTTLILPNGRMVPLGGMPGASGDGGAGLQADVNNHVGSLAVAVLAGTTVDVIRGLASFGSGGNDNVIVSLGGGALADRSASVAEKLVDRELSRRPTLTAKPEEMAVQVTRPIQLERYRD